MRRTIRALVLPAAIILTMTRCADDKLPTPSNAHPADWTRKGTDQFHGVKVMASGYLSCTGCHGAALDGGEAGIACRDCHATFPHPQGWTTLSSPQFHGITIAAANWQLGSCRACHGEDYHGGSSGSSCYTCHTDENGPEACHTCHGSLENDAPPKDLSGHLSTASLGVGAHQKHLNNGVACTVCHLVPQRVSDEGHLDGMLPAEVTTSLEWDRTKATCTTSCHTDPQKQYTWNR